MRNILSRLLGFGAITMFQKALGFAIVTQLVGLLGASEYGIYAYLLNLANLAAMIVMFGFPQLLTREVAIYRASSRPQLLEGLLRFAWVYVAVGSIAVATTTLAVCYSECEVGPRDYSFTTIAALFVFGTVTVTGLQQAILRGHDVLMNAVWPSMLLQPAILLSILVLSRNTHWELTAFEALTWTAFANLLALICLAYYIRKNRSNAPREASVAREYNLSKWWRSLLPFFFIGGLWMLLQRSDILVLGIFRTSTEVGYYAVAAQMAFLANLPSAIVNTTIEPQLATAYSKGEFGRMQKYYADCAILSGCAGLAAIAVLGFIGPWLLPILFGADFTISYLPMMLIGIGYVAGTLFGSSDTFLSMAGQERKTLLAGAVATLLNIALNFGMVPPYGMIGAATATMISLIVCRLILAAMIYRDFGIYPGPLWYLFGKSGEDRQNAET